MRFFLFFKDNFYIKLKIGLLEQRITTLEVKTDLGIKILKLGTDLTITSILKIEINPKRRTFPTSDELATYKRVDSYSIFN